MPNTTININFSEYKLKAIEQALKEKQEPKSVQELLVAHVDGLYQKNVPAPARKYLDSIMGESQAAPQPNQAAPAQESEPRQRRQYNRRENSAQQQESTDPNAVEQPELEQTEPESEINMSM